jgi:protein transport protein SEC24
LCSEGLWLSRSAFQYASPIYCCCCLQAYLYIGTNVEPAALQDLLGVPSWQDLPPPDAQTPTLPRLNTRLNDAAHDIINTARLRNGRFMRLRVVAKGRPEESLFNARLFEDKIGGVMSYIEFLCHVHKCICDNLRKG